MRYDNIFWVVAAPGLASCACFAFEKFSNFAESWNDRFEGIRRGFEMIGGKAKRGHIHVFSQGADDELCRSERFDYGSEARYLDGNRRGSLKRVG